MLIPSFKEIENVAESRYALVILVSKRARKIVAGSKPFVKTASKKPVSIAMEEILDGDIVFGEKMTNKQYKKKIEEERKRKLEIIKAEREAVVSEVLEEESC